MQSLRTLLLAVVLLLTACAPPAVRPDIRPDVTEADARAFLSQAVSLAMARDFTGLCNLGSGTGMCNIILGHGMKETVPNHLPKVVCSYRLPGRQYPDGGFSVGGLVLVVEGVNGQGRPYETDVLVFHDGRSLSAINLVWWSGYGIAQTNTTPARESSPRDSCPETP